MSSFTDPPNGGKGPIRPAHLTLVHPAPPKARPVRGSHWRATLFTPEETARLRAALMRSRSIFGSWACAADAMRMPVRTLQYAARGTGRVTGAIAIRLAKTLGVPVESLYGPPRPAGTCAACGRGPT